MRHALLRHRIPPQTDRRAGDHIDRSTRGDLGYRRPSRCQDAGLPGAGRSRYLRPVRVPRRGPAPVPRQAHLQEAAADDRGTRAVRSGHRRRRRARGEGVGPRPRGDALHALVRSHDRLHGREARLVPDADRRRPDDRRVLRPEPGAGRAGRELVPVGRHPRDVRGPRLHRLGRHLADLPPGRAERRHADDPDGLRLVHRRGARPQDPAAALAGGARQARAARPALVRQQRSRSASSRTSDPSRSTSSSTAGSPSTVPTSCSPAGPCSGPLRPRARSWRTSTSARSASGSWRS